MRCHVDGPDIVYADPDERIEVRVRNSADPVDAISRALNAVRESREMHTATPVEVGIPVRVYHDGVYAGIIETGAIRREEYRDNDGHALLSELRQTIAQRRALLRMERRLGWWQRLRGWLRYRPTHWPTARVVHCPGVRRNHQGKA